MGDDEQPPGAPGPPHTGPVEPGTPLPVLLAAGTEDLFEHAPCGYLLTLPDGLVVKANATLLEWLDRPAEEVVGRLRFADLLTVGGRLYHETHYAPLLAMHGQVSGIALELSTARRARLPVLATSSVVADREGHPRLIRTALFDARDRRSYERELLRARREAEHERARLARLAGTLRRSLLPPSLPDVPGLQVAALFRPASSDEVGGDFYDLFPLPDGRWGVSVGDVTGKGAEAAALTALVRYTLRAAAITEPDPVAVLTTLNSALNQEYRPEDPRFCTVLYGVLSPGGGESAVVLGGGGHPPALVLRGGGGATFAETPGGQIIGILPDADVAVATVRLGPGDTLVLYTDGLTEARTAPPGPALLGEEELLRFAAGLAPATPGAVVEALGGLLDDLGAGVQDDTAVLALGVPPRR
jgi:sigma-B regulation protein RsbU (phosphoserine phosphatase)